MPVSLAYALVGVQLRPSQSQAKADCVSQVYPDVPSTAVRLYCTNLQVKGSTMLSRVNLHFTLHNLEPINPYNGCMAVLLT